MKFEEEDMTLILLNSLLESYDNLVHSDVGEKNLRIGGDQKCYTIL